MDRSEELGENALGLPRPFRKWHIWRKWPPRQDRWAAPWLTVKHFFIFLMFSRKFGLMGNTCQKLAPKKWKESFPLKTTKTTQNPRTWWSAWLLLGPADHALIWKICSACGSDHRWNPLLPSNPWGPSRQAERSCLPSFKVSRLKSILSPLHQVKSTQVERPLACWKTPSQPHGHPDMRPWVREQRAGRQPRLSRPCIHQPQQGSEQGDRASFESKPRVSVLISTGIASLGWISKDSVTNEKHTSSWNEVNFFKKKKKKGFFFGSVDIY